MSDGNGFFRQSTGQSLAGVGGLDAEENQFHPAVDFELLENVVADFQLIEKLPNAAILLLHATVVDVEKILGLVHEAVEGPGHNPIGFRVDGDQGDALAHPLDKSFDCFRVGFARQTGSQGQRLTGEELTINEVDKFLVSRLGQRLNDG